MMCLSPALLCKSYFRLRETLMLANGEHIRNTGFWAPPSDFDSVKSWVETQGFTF